MQIPLHRFEEFGPLSEAERAAVIALCDPPKTYQRHAVIREQGARPDGFFLLANGWVAASTSLPNGGRQILKIHLPGDALDTPSMCVTEAAQTLTALTAVTCLHVPFHRFGKLFAESPKLIARFMLSIQLERVALIDRLASFGQTSAKQSAAAFLLDMLDRLRPLNVVTSNGFHLPISQEIIADVLGLTTIHVNRVIKALEKDGLISREGQHVRICNPKALARLSLRPDRSSLNNPFLTNG